MSQRESTQQPQNPFRSPTSVSRDAQNSPTSRLLGHEKVQDHTAISRLPTPTPTNGPDRGHPNLHTRASDMHSLLNPTGTKRPAEDALERPTGENGGHMSPALKRPASGSGPLSNSPGPISRPPSTVHSPAFPFPPMPRSGSAAPQPPPSYAQHQQPPAQQQQQQQQQQQPPMNDVFTFGRGREPTRSVSVNGPMGGAKPMELTLPQPHLRLNPAIVSPSWTPTGSPLEMPPRVSVTLPPFGPNHVQGTSPLGTRVMSQPLQRPNNAPNDPANGLGRRPQGPGMPGAHSHYGPPSGNHAGLAGSSLMEDVRRDLQAADRGSGVASDMILNLPNSNDVLHVPVDTRQASRAADDKRKRNSEASSRFRKRRKEKDAQMARDMDLLEANIEEANQEIRRLRMICASSTDRATREEAERGAPHGIPPWEWRPSRSQRTASAEEHLSGDSPPSHRHGGVQSGRVSRVGTAGRGGRAPRQQPPRRPSPYNSDHSSEVVSRRPDSSAMSDYPHPTGGYSGYSTPVAQSPLAGPPLMPHGPGFATPTPSPLLPNHGGVPPPGGLSLPPLRSLDPGAGTQGFQSGPTSSHHHHPGPVATTPPPHMQQMHQPPPHALPPLQIPPGHAPPSAGWAAPTSRI